ncbi:MAG: MEDS domain-containing protein [Pseudomonadota bacterium]
MEKDETALLNITDAAIYLNVSKATLRRWTDAGRLHCLRIGARKERRFRQTDLDNLVDGSMIDRDVDAVLTPDRKAEVSTHCRHQCVISNTPDEEWAILGPAILQALLAGAQVLLIDASDRRVRLEQLLRERKMELSDVLEAQRLICVSIEESYRLCGAFRWDRAVAYIESMILAAKARGFTEVLVIGANCGQAEPDKAYYAAQMKLYEAGLDDMLQRHPEATVLCPYNTGELTAEEMVQGIMTHPQLRFSDGYTPGLLGQMNT